MLKDQISPDKKTLIYVASPGFLQMVYQAIRRYPDCMRLFPDTLDLIRSDTEGWTRVTAPVILAITTPAHQEGVRAMEELADILDGKKTDGEVVFKDIVKWGGITL